MAGPCKVCNGTTQVKDPYCEGCGAGIKVEELAPTPKPRAKKSPAKAPDELDET
jgi:hypothetical protein